MNVELPDGTLVEGVPDGTSKVDLLGKLQRAGHPSAPALMKQMASQETLGEMGGLDKFNAGMGLAFANLGRGTKQVLGMGGGDYEDNKGIDKALTSTGAGMAGNVAGNMAMLAPAAVVPGANAVAGAGTIGAITAALQPTDTTNDRLKNMAVGGALGAGTQAAAGPIARKLGEWGADREAAALSRQSQNSVRDKTLSDAMQAGYVVPPSAVNPSGVNKILESISGKAAVGQEASIRNQAVTDKLARSAIGLPDDAPITEAALKGVRQAAAAPYREIETLASNSPLNKPPFKDPAKTLEELKEVRSDAKAYWKHYNVSADPKSLAEAKLLDEKAELLEDSIDAIAKGLNKPDLLERLRESRKLIAKTYTVEHGLNVGSGSVDARDIGRQLDRGAPLTGDLSTIGRFAEAFSPYAREGSAIPTPGVSKIAALSSALMGGGGAAAAGPMGVAAGAIPFIAPPAARSLVLSKPYQQRMAAPDYSVGPVTRGAAALDDPETQKRLAMLARSLALPAIPQVNQ